MSEFKTLYDMDTFEIKDKKGFSSQVIDKEELREEAIKWIKEDIERYEREGFVSILNMKQINEWRHRFNLTREDLQ